MPKLIYFLGMILMLSIPLRAQSSPNKIFLFAGAASRPPTEKVIQNFQNKFGASVEVIFGGSGFVLSQMKLAKRGDLYFPGSSDFMEVAKRENLIFPDSEKEVVYLVPAINIQKGNPKRIKTLKDLTQGGVRIAIANPETVCVGTYAVEIIEKNLNTTDKVKFKKNLINYTESCEKTANVISLKAVDAVMGWSVFQYWDPERIETVYLNPQEIPRIGYIPIAISKFSKNKKLAQLFIDFLLSQQGKEIFQKYRYFMGPQEARSLTRPDTPVGGEYVLPEEWRRMGK